ncbi:2-amino-4-hydroxy-6-hydroxymethyldihydropteridine diphosphokinase [bacterium CPR1]|nr:2-amino-4-hydroxy-6-hydroxymethyldihydropteridine diphosphokinase [bacterium CPR1]
MIFLDLGSNLEREQSLRKTLAALERTFQLKRRSTVYESPPYPVGSLQPSFFNLAVEIETELPPAQLRGRLRELEAELGRRRSADKFAPRTIDLDLTLYHDRVERHSDWELPHPQVASQPFVLMPLVELEPELVHPTLKVSLRELLERVAHGPEHIWRSGFRL